MVAPNQNLQTLSRRLNDVEVDLTDTVTTETLEETLEDYETVIGAEEKATDAYNDSVALIAALLLMPIVDWTNGETRPVTNRRCIFIVFADALPDYDLVSDPHPGGPKPGDILFEIASAE